MNNGKAYLTVEEVAGRFHVNTTTIYRLAQKGKLPAFKIGNQWRFNPELLKHWEIQQLDKDEFSQKHERGK